MSETYWIDRARLHATEEWLEGAVFAGPAPANLGLSEQRDEPRAETRDAQARAVEAWVRDGTPPDPALFPERMKPTADAKLSQAAHEAQVEAVQRWLELGELPA